MDCKLKKGDFVGAGVLYRINEHGIHDHSPTTDLLTNRRVVIFGGPAPFSRLDTEQAKAYAELSAEITKYVDSIYGVYCQDAFVMNQFDKHIKESFPEHKIEFWADGDGFFTRGHGLDHNFTYQGLSLRSGRYAMVVNRETLQHVFLDEYQLIENTAADKVLEWLKQSK